MTPAGAASSLSAPTTLAAGAACATVAAVMAAAASAMDAMNFTLMMAILPLLLSETAWAS
jgi:hypothetical protein